VPVSPRLTAAQLRELEAELRRELIALERRLASERQADAAESDAAGVHDVSIAVRGASDTALRHDLVASALARLASGTYGACSRCGDAIPFGRLLVMPEVTNCLRCSGRS
jgi:DnaK suppressor protein